MLYTRYWMLDAPFRYICERFVDEWGITFARRVPIVIGRQPHGRNQRHTPNNNFYKALRTTLGIYDMT